MLVSQGTAVDNAHTGSSLPLTGAYWQGSTGADQTAFFDNVKVTVVGTVMGIPGVTITESAGATSVAEGGATDSYTVVLNTQPSADVTITVDPDGQLDLGMGAGNPVMLIFNAGNWDDAQTITVEANDDAVIEGNHNGVIAHSAASADADYNGINIVGVTASITDNDNPPAPPAPVINEFIANHVSSDNKEFVEIFGDPNTDYSAYSILSIEGDNTVAGIIDRIYMVGTTNANGFWITTDAAMDQIENGSMTLLLVRGFTGSAGQDLDTDNDGVFDVTPWAELVDGVAVKDNDNLVNDRTYDASVLFQNYDGINLVPGAASRIPDGNDNDSRFDWVRNDFDLFGIPGFAGTPTVGEAKNTPNESNETVNPRITSGGVCAELSDGGGILFSGNPTSICSGREINVDVSLDVANGYAEGTDYHFEIVSVQYNGATHTGPYEAGYVLPLADSRIQEILTNSTGFPITVTYTVAVRELLPNDYELCATKFFSVEVNPSTLASAIELVGPSSSCEGDGSSVVVKLSVSGGSSPFDLFYNDVINGRNAQCMPIASGGTGEALNDADGIINLDYSGNAAGTYTVTLDSVADDEGCFDPTNRFVTFTINEAPKFNTDRDTTIYTCTPVSFDLESHRTSCEAVTYNWYSVANTSSTNGYNNPNVAGETFTSFTGDLEGDGPVIDDVLTNLTSAVQTIYYYVTATTANNCDSSFYITVTVRPKVQFDCIGCGSKINVTLDATTCGAEVTLDMVLLNVAACAAAKDIPVSLIYEALEVVVDDGVGADNIVTCPGQHKYLVRLKPGYENCLIWQPCWGVVNAEDKSAPLYTSWIGKCNVGTLAVPGQTELLNGQFTNSTAAFLCLNAEELFNKENTWKDATSALFAGRPVFVDACHNDYCKCSTTLKATDELTYFTCDEIGSTYPGVPSGYEAWARLKRTFTATDCYGNFVQGYQHIYLVRPQAVTFGNELLKSLKYQVAQASCDTIVEDYDADKNCCGEVDYELDLACLVGGDKCAAPTAEEMLRLFKTKLRIQDSLDCVTDRGYAFFAEGVDSKYKLLGCNYSFDAQVVNTFPVCGNGKKVLVKLSYFDWCNPGQEHGLENCTYVLLKWYDTQAPVFTDVRKVKYEEPERMCKDDFAMAQNVPVSVISTGAMDCTASVFTDRAGLEEYLGWQIKDNCDQNPSVSVLKMERWGLEYAYGIPLSADSCWYEETYQVMVVGGRPVVTGLAPGLYRFTVEAFDHCYNKATKALYFRVVDKIAPVMKCDDQLNITLSNAQGAGYGQQYPTQGYNYYGYARVNKADVDEGSWDNCGMERIKIRRSYDAACQADFLAKGYGKGANGDGDDLIEAGVDGWDENGDGTLQDHEKFVSVTRSGVTTIMTPWLDYAEFFCCDLGNKVVVELGGWDKSGNFSYCWSEQLIEDKVLPTYILPWPVTIKCTDRAWVEGLLTAAGKGAMDVTGSDYQSLVSAILTAQGGAQNVLVTMSGNDCANTAVKATVTTNLHCEAGTVTVSYAYTKTTSKGDVTGSIGTVVITVQPVHEYNILFPADLEGDCSNLRDTANVIDGGELSCDVLAVNVSDKRYNGATLNGAPVAECYKIFRTFTVINWCQYDERCGEPMQYAIVVPRDPNDNGTNWDDAGGVNVLVRDKDMDGDEEIYYEDEDGTVAYPNDEVNWANQGPKTVSDDDAYWYDERGESYPQTCAYASYGNNGDEYFAFMYTQYIFVHDQVRPEVLDPSEQVFYQNKNTCSSTVAIEFAAQDLCSGATEVQQVPAVAGNLAIERVKLNGGELPSYLTVTPAHALNGDDKGTNAWVVTGTGDASQLPIGDHKLTVIVRDDCGNLSLAKDIPFSIKDTNGIAPICYHGLSTDLMKDPDTGEGAMAIWATDFKASDVADCNAKTVGVKENIPDNQYYVVKDSGADGIADGVWDSHDGLNEDGIPTNPQTSVTFTCADAKVTQVAVRLYTKDALGNWAWCETYAIVTDARKVCPSAAASAAIGGAITTENKESVEGVEVALSGHSSVTKMTGRDGEFGFSGVTLGYDYSVTPHLDKNPLNGVSTFDLVLITKHILGVQPLNSPYKLIAADVNNSRSVTTLDLIQLRKLILGIDTKYANNTSWRFVDRTFKFTDPSNPWKTQFPEVANLNDLAADAKADFVAVKVGDVNGNAIANSIVRTAGTFELKADDQELKAGNEYRIAFTGDLKSVEGLQFTMSYDVTAVELVDVEYGVAKEEHFGIFAKEGVLTASWNGDAKSNTFATLVFRATADATLSEVLNINSRVTAAEAYRQGGDYLSVSLALTPQRPNASTLFALEQNTPNPFSGETVIGFSLPVAGEATLTIQDVTGRTLRVVRGQFAQGYNQVNVKASDLNATGVLSYTLKAGEYTATKKMIILE
jgi:hypothetical protein